MKAVPYQPHHYEILSQWWSAHGWPTVPQDHLPDTGFVVYDNNTPIAAGFIYVTNSVFALMDWIVADRAASRAERGEAQNLVIQSIFKFAKEHGIKSIYATTNHPRLVSRYEEHGFVMGEEIKSFTKRIE